MNRKTFVTAQVELFRRIATVAQTVRGEAPETRTCRSEEPELAQIFGDVGWDQAPAALFSAADGRNFRALEALIRIASPVCGLRPLRAGRLVMVKVPKLPMV